MIPLADLNIWLEGERAKALEGSARHFALTYALLDLPRLTNAPEVVNVLRVRIRTVPTKGRRIQITDEAEAIITFIEASYRWDIWEDNGGDVSRKEGPYADLEGQRRAVELWQLTGIPHVPILIGGSIEKLYQQWYEQAKAFKEG